MKKGFAQILIVFIICIVGMLVVVAWEARLLGSVHRSQSLADIVKAGYGAETVIYDTLARFLGNYPLPVNGSETLSDGTNISLNNSIDGNTEIFSVIAKRSFATTKIELEKVTNVTESNQIDKVEVIIQMDCTGSMDSKSDNSCVGTTGDGTGGTCATRMAREKQAVKAFLDKIRSLPEEQKDKFLVGIEVFKVDTRWLGGLTPNNDIDNLYNLVNSSFGVKTGSSPGCSLSHFDWQGAFGETSLGAATLFSTKYQKASAEAKKLQISILITDGLPNCAIDSAVGECDISHVCLNETNGYVGGVVTAINELKCGTARNDIEWSPGLSGQRPKNVLNYGVITMANLPNYDSRKVVYDKVIEVFSNPDYFTNFYNPTNSESLPAILEEIFKDVVNGTVNFSIRRVVPTPD